MLLRKEQAAITAPPGGRQQLPVPHPFPPAQGRAGSYHSQDRGGRGRDSSLVPLCAEEVRRDRGGCLTVPEQRSTGTQGGGGVPAVRVRILVAVGRCVRYRGCLWRERGDMSTCSVSKVRGRRKGKGKGKDGAPSLSCLWARRAASWFAPVLALHRAGPSTVRKSAARGS